MTDVIAPFSHKIVLEEVKNVNFLCISTDASNHKAIKLFPTLIRYFDSEHGIRVKVLDFSELPGETSELIHGNLMQILSKHNLENKVVGFCGDNANTNFGGVKRQGQNNVFYRLKQSLNKNLIGVGCAGHIIHNSIQTASDLLPIDTEVIIVKIYSHFYIYTVRSEALKEFCKEAEIKYQNLLGYAKRDGLLYYPVWREY